MRKPGQSTDLSFTPAKCMPLSSRPLSRFGMAVLRMFVRTTNRIGKIGIADSKDNGITWSELKTDRICRIRIAASTRSRLKDGRIV